MQNDNIIIGDGNELNDSNDNRDNVETANIFTSSEHMELEKFRDPHKEAVLAEFERRRRARQMTLPTDDGEIKLMLRQLEQPICLFGEDKPDRRERLRTFLSMLDEEEAQRILRKEEPKVEKPKEENTTWYHRGGETLRDARIFIARYSLPRAQKRLQEARERKDIAPQVKAIKIQETNRWAQGLNNQCSQIGDTRPVAHCQFSPDSKYVATAGWSGLCKLWSLPDCQLIREYKGHTSRAGCMTFHPDAKLDEPAQVVDEDNAPTNVDMASCASDGSVLLWNYNNDTPLADIEGHQPYRVSKLRFHPSGRFLATTCFDNSWRLFDLESNEEILFQEGHSKPVYDLDFQCDGSLAVTGGLDCYGRAWDLRTGRCVMFLEGHQMPILAVKFSPDGYRVITAGKDNTCKIWDLRSRQNIYTLPAHTNLISNVCFDPRQFPCNFLVTASYDHTLKVWTHPGWQPLRTLIGHNDKVTCVDVSHDGQTIVSSSFDKTFKVWSLDA